VIRPDWIVGHALAVFHHRLRSGSYRLGGARHRLGKVRDMVQTGATKRDAKLDALGLCSRLSIFRNLTGIGRDAVTYYGIDFAGTYRPFIHPED
jgi:hypothetical protein